MKRTSLILAAGAWVGLTAGWATAGPVAPKPAAKEQAKKVAMLPPEYKWMSKELTLTDDQQNKIAEKLKTFKKVFDELQKADRDRLKEINTDMATARKSRDAAMIKELETKRAALMAEMKGEPARSRAKTKDKIEAEIMPLLTADQKSKWATYEALREIAPLFKGVALNAEQQGKLRELVAAKSDSILSNWGMGEADTVKARAEILKGIAAEAKENILTEEQRKRMPKEKTVEPASVKDKDKGKGGEGN